MKARRMAMGAFCLFGFAAALLPGAGGAATAARRPAPLSNEALVELFNSTPLPNVAVPQAAANYFDPIADARVASLAEARGYRLRGSPVDARLGYYGGVPLQEAAIRDMQRLQEAMLAESGTSLTMSYGFRSTDLQRGIFTGNAGVSAASVASGAADGALQTTMNRIAPSGYSKHHTGYTVDVRAGGVGGYGIVYTSGYAWLAADGFANAKRFGWLPSYPPGVANLGPQPEPWEWVWVGEAAIRCAEEPICVDSTQERFGAPGDRVVARGWAVPEVPGERVKVRLVVDGVPSRAVRPRLSRPDVATALGLVNTAVGYEVSVPVQPGAHWACVETWATSVRLWERQECSMLEIDR